MKVIIYFETGNILGCDYEFKLATCIIILVEPRKHFFNILETEKILMTGFLINGSG